MTLQLMVNDSVMYLGPRGKDTGTVVLSQLTKQIENLEKKGLIVVREAR